MGCWGGRSAREPHCFEQALHAAKEHQESKQARDAREQIVLPAAIDHGVLRRIRVVKYGHRLSYEKWRIEADPISERNIRPAAGPVAPNGLIGIPAQLTGTGSAGAAANVFPSVLHHLSLCRGVVDEELVCIRAMDKPTGAKKEGRSRHQRDDSHDTVKDDGTRGLEPTVPQRVC